jgi:hypothetical protein
LLSFDENWQNDVKLQRIAQGNRCTKAFLEGGGSKKGHFLFDIQTEKTSHLRRSENKEENALGEGKGRLGRCENGCICNHERSKIKD